MGFLQIGKKKKKKSSQEQQLMIRSSSKKSSSSLSTSSSSPPTSPVDAVPGTATASAASRRKTGIFRNSLISRRGTTTSRIDRKPTTANNHQRADSASPRVAAPLEPNENVAPVDVRPYETYSNEDTRRSVLSSLRILPTNSTADDEATASAADETSTSYHLSLDEIEVREEDDEDNDLHYSPSPRRALRFDNMDDSYDDDIHNESFEIVLSHMDTPVIDNRAVHHNDEAISTVITPEPSLQASAGTGATTSSASSTVTASNSFTGPIMATLLDAAYDEEEDEDDEPFDAKETQRQIRQLSEDPTISELDASENESNNKPQHEQQRQQPEPPMITPETNVVNINDKNVDIINNNDDKNQSDESNMLEDHVKALLGTPTHASVRRKLIDVFNCVGPGVDSNTALNTKEPTTTFHLSPTRRIPMIDFFYDNVCGAHDASKTIKKRPFFNEHFALDFLRKMIFEGITLLYMEPSISLSTTQDNEKEDDWTGESVTLFIRPGVLSSSLQLPRLEWSTWGGGWSHPSIRTSYLDLLQIHSVLDHEAFLDAAVAVAAKEPNSPDGDPTLSEVDAAALHRTDQDVFAFTVTSERGEVHIFEASSQNERDQIVCGLKNILARLSFQLISGDVHLVNELFRTPKSREPYDSSSADLPALVAPRYAVQGMAHRFLDS